MPLNEDNTVIQAVVSKERKKEYEEVARSKHLTLSKFSQILLEVGFQRLQELERKSSNQAKLF